MLWENGAQTTWGSMFKTAVQQQDEEPARGVWGNPISLGVLPIRPAFALYAYSSPCYGNDRTTQLCGRRQIEQRRVGDLKTPACFQTPPHPTGG